MRVSWQGNDKKSTHAAVQEPKFDAIKGGLGYNTTTHGWKADKTAVVLTLVMRQVAGMTEFVVPHDPRWTSAFEREARSIASSLGGDITLHHIGSTAIPDILAKPIIDLLGVVADLEFMDMQSNKMEFLGYQVMGPYGIESRRYFRKINAAGLRTHHLHVFAGGSPHIERHLAFRDYLRNHPKVAADYSALKASLTAGETPSWENYMDGKDPFISATEKDALNWYDRTPPE